MHKRNLDYFFMFVSMVTFLYILYFSILNIMKLHNFHLPGYNIGTFSYVAWKLFTEGFNMGLPVSLDNYYAMGKFYFFISPMLVFCCFIYLLSNMLPESLLIFQVLAIGIGAIPIFLITRNKLHNGFIAAMFSLAYLVHPAVNAVTLIGIFPSSAAVPLLLFAFYFLETRNKPLFTLCIALSILSRVEIAITVFLYGLCLLFKSRDRELGKLCIWISGLWLGVVAAVLISFSHGITWQIIAASRLDSFGKSASEIISNIIHNPAILSSNIRMSDLSVFLAMPIPFFLTAVIYPIYLVPLAPVFLYAVLIGIPGSASIVFIPFIFISSIYGAEIVSQLLSKKLHFLSVNLARKSVVILLLLLCLIHHYYFWFAQRSISMDKIIPYSKESSEEYYRTNRHVRIGYEVIKQLPTYSPCVVQYSLLPFVANRKDILIIEHIIAQKKTNFTYYDYVLCDLRGDVLPGISIEDFHKKISELLRSGVFKIRIFDDGWLLLERGSHDLKDDTYEAVLNMLK